MIVSEFQERLRTHDATANLFATVEGAAEISEIEKRPPALPACFVLLMREVSADNTRATGGVLQRSEVDIAVVIVAENLSDHRGEAAASDIEALKKAVRRALIGWEPASAADVVTHVSGELTNARGGAVWWEDTFATATYLEDES